MKSRELRNLGIPSGEAVELAQGCVAASARSGMNAAQIRRIVRSVVDDPARFCEHPHFGALADMLILIARAQSSYRPREQPAPYRQWGDDLDSNSIEQMENACSLPIAARGALMPDAHVGYGLPIGGVLATRNAVIPYAVGVDIACRMKMTVLDLSTDMPDKRPDLLKKAIEDETRFGIGSSFKKRRAHDVLDDDWSVTGVTSRVKDKAWAQLGSSGSGNHFVEFGIIEITNDSLALEPGTYLALLSHSGSRGAGATVAGHYSRLAMELHRELPPRLRHLAWLDLDSEPGQEYWSAMELMGRYAAANHACIHRHIVKHLGARVLLDLENHHNFAWRERHDGETMIVHRKGATPAGEGVLGIIPGSMATWTYVVRGKGNEDSLQSAAHGAGRVMSRKKAKETFRWKEAREMLDERGVTLMSAGLDEVPMVYKDIDKVMAAQSDLVQSVARFFPRIVKMAPAGERPED
jgi:tRNA-splicing ligase RtcB